MANDLIEKVTSGELWTMPVGVYAYTGDIAEKGARGAVALAVQGKPPRLADALNMELEIVNLLLHRIAMTDTETGEAKTLMRLCVFTRDGKVYSTSGGKAIKDALLPAMLFGAALPYVPAQRFRVTLTKTRADGGGYINLEWIGECKK